MGLTLVVRGLYNHAWDNPDLISPRLNAVIWGYEPGDPLVEGWRHVTDIDDVISCAPGEQHDDDDCYKAVCDYFYLKYNRDDRPNGQTERSLSIGDIIEIAVSENDIRRYGCVALGWERLPMERTEV